MRDVRKIAATAVTLNNASSRRRKTANIITVVTSNGPWNRGSCMHQLHEKLAAEFTSPPL